jgi:hypothetical protein
MEPIHIHALLHVKVDEQLRREQLEQHFAVRAEASQNRRGRFHRRRQLLIGRIAPGSRGRPAV